MPAVPWLLNTAYVVLLLAVSPLLLYRRCVLGKYRDGWGEKLLGRLPRRSGERPCLWFHAVSVGEVLQLKEVLTRIRTVRPDVELVVTTTTSTGLDVARKSFPDDCVCYFPLDFSWSVRRALQRVRPTAIVLVELELWPNFIFAARDAGIPLALINGRISENSHRGYRRVSWLMRRLLACFEVLAVQNETYADRLLELGALPKRLERTGSIKFDGLQTDRCNPSTTELRHSFELAEDEAVFVAGSTQAPEEELALSTYRELRREFPRLRLVLVPRHKERFEEVARLVRSQGFPLMRRSTIADQADNRQPLVAASHSHAPPVLLLDTLGELAACWGLADVAFVGGSLTSRGGQNMIEPAGYGAAVLFGPNTWNFRDVVELLLDNKAALVVRDGDQLTHSVRRLLTDPQKIQTLGGPAQEIVLAQQGATQKTVDLVLNLLPRDGERSALSRSRAA